MQVVDPAVIGVAPNSPYTSLSALIDAAKANPGTITATTTGIQTGEHFALAQINQVTGPTWRRCTSPRGVAGRRGVPGQPRPGLRRQRQ